MGRRLFDGISSALLAMSPLFLLLVVVALLTPILVSGWLFTFAALQPDFGRLSPLRGLGRVVSLHGAIEMGKAVLKTLLIGGGLAYLVRAAKILALIGQSMEPAGASGGCWAGPS
jgi:flagellar biosynthetic protein FlhB